MSLSSFVHACLMTLLLSGQFAFAGAQVDFFPTQPTCDPSQASCTADTAPAKCNAMSCFATLEAQAKFEKDNNCKFTSNNDQTCTEKWRMDKKFLEKSEGALILPGYIPVYKDDIKDKKGNIIHKKGDVIGQSGVTISTGIDLGQQSAAVTKAVINAYIKDNGNPDKVDVATLMKTLDPYFGLKRQKAVDALVKTSLTVTKAEAKLLADAFGYDTQKRVVQRFDAKNIKGMVFKKLPEEAQTVIVDFAYQYGVYSDSKGVGKTFWAYVYAGEWKKLADWLLSKPDQYISRRKREGDRLQQGIDNKHLPDSGNPCPPDNQAGGSQNKL